MIDGRTRTATEQFRKAQARILKRNRSPYYPFRTFRRVYDKETDLFSKERPL